mmetsp:Transcript_32548/g.64553  ORF Transcript_32548/g.64553 Transcript_32548/m.64553 type:complete len:288 (-) Transcript_32548:1132-1995(-)
MELLSLRAHLIIIEDLRIASVGIATTQLPGLEEGVPVDEWDHILNALRYHLDSHLIGALSRRISVEIDLKPLAGRLRHVQIHAALQTGKVVLAHLLVLFHHRLNVLDFVGIEKVRYYSHRTTGVKNVNDWVVGRRVHRSNLHSCVHLGCSSATNQQGLLHTALGHFLGHGHHLIKRRGDQTGKTDHIHIQSKRFIQDFLAGAHYAQVEHLVVIAAQHNCHNVLPDIVDISLHRGDQESTREVRSVVFVDGVWILALCKHLSSLLTLHEGEQVCDGLLHHSSRLNDLW